jgi:hypothetical protein
MIKEIVSFRPEAAFPDFNYACLRWGRFISVCWREDSDALISNEILLVAKAAASVSQFSG